MLNTVFIIAWLTTLFFIGYGLYLMLSTQMKKYFDTTIKDVKPLILASQKSFFVNGISACDNNKSTFRQIFDFETLHTNLPFSFKMYLLPDCIVLTNIGKSAIIFKRSECTFSKKGFFSYFTMIKNNKKYMLDVGFHHKLIKDWIGNN